MTVFLLHRSEFVVIFVLLLSALGARLNSFLAANEARVKGQRTSRFYKDAHRAELVKQWVTSQYCKTDLDILCPRNLPTTGCYAAFDPPLLFVLDLIEKEEDRNGNCSMQNLLVDVSQQQGPELAEMDHDDLLMAFIAHVVQKIRKRSAELFRAEDRSILEFEQSRLIELSLASFLDLFSSPIKQDENGQTLATKATEYGLTKHIWTREEVLRIMDDSVMYITHRLRHGTTETGAAARLSRQQPSFVFKYLPLVKEQIQNLQYDVSTELKSRNFYPFTPLGQELLFLDDVSSPSDSCLKYHYEEGSLVSQDCILALDTAPTKIRELDWEGKYWFVLVYVYTFMSGAFALWLMSRIFTLFDVSKSSSSRGDQEGDYTLTCIVPKSLDSVKRTALFPRGEQIRRMQKACLVYLVLSLLMGYALSKYSEVLRFSDFLDGLCLALIGFLSLHLVPMVQQKRISEKTKREDRSREVIGLEKSELLFRVTSNKTDTLIDLT